jgi:hypothetical protein
MSEVTAPAWREKVSVLIKGMAEMPQAKCPLKHYFAPGVYIREIFMPKDSAIIGKIHKTEHFNIIQQGCVTLIGADGDRTMLRAPYTFVSKPGVQKVLYIHEDTIWSTVHLTEERDLEKLEAALIEPDDYPAFDRTEEKQMIEQAQTLALPEGSP